MAFALGMATKVYVGGADTALGCVVRHAFVWTPFLTVVDWLASSWDP